MVVMLNDIIGLKDLSLKELKAKTEAERAKNVIAVRVRHILTEVRYYY